MNQTTHCGTLPTGTRVHLTNANGWSACSRQIKAITPIEERPLGYDGVWCGMCLARIVQDEILFADLRLRRTTASRWDSTRVVDNFGRTTQALFIAVEALTEIAKLDDGTASASMAFEAAEKIKVELDSLKGGA